MSNRDSIRWLLCVLGEPAFLRLYLETRIDGPGGPGPRYPVRLFEDTFWALPADVERPENARKPAWDSLCEWLGTDEQTALDWFCAILRGLRQHDARADVADLARFWAAPELVTDGIPGPAPLAPIDGYHEIHCHVRGAVPFWHLWQDWLINDRARSRLRTQQCTVGSWKKTWAEIVAHAACAWQHFAREPTPALPEPHAPEHLSRIVSLLLDQTAWSELRLAAGHYLAVYVAVRRHFLFQRGEAGLVRFTDSYDRYSKLQKRRGRRDHDQTRSDVAAIMRRFQAEGASAVELRPTMDTRRKPFQDKLHSIVLGYFDYVRTHAEPGRPVVMGMVPSLYKQQACDKREDDGTGHMWNMQTSIWHHQLDILFAILDDVPALRFFVVGVDAAGRERGCPPRAYAPLMQRVRDYGRRRGIGLAPLGRVVSPESMYRLVHDTSRRGASDLVDDPARSREAFEALNSRHVSRVRLGRTVHAGEDFVDPMTGLRHIWETLCACDLGPGDRIGHAVAAGLHPQDVRDVLDRRSGAGEVTRLEPGVWQLRKSRGVHALDLVWLAQMAAENNRARWHAELGALSASLLGVPAHTDRLAIHLQTSLHLPALPSARFVDPASVSELDCTWHRVDRAWLDTFESMRTRVLAEIARRRVIIESCPSSNLAVLGLEHPPIWRFLEDRVTCAIATDDPGLLDAWPRRELAYRDRRGGPLDRERVLQANRQASFIKRREP